MKKIHRRLSTSMAKDSEFAEKEKDDSSVNYLSSS